MMQEVKAYLEKLRENDPEWASYVRLLVNNSDKELSLKELKQLAITERFYYWDGLPMDEFADG
ncbi:MAG: hypothetical protein MK106_01925 [Mariniblastus sp.]|nr:hypothetical protein [Mariniblastus sp.]